MVKLASHNGAVAVAVDPRRRALLAKVHLGVKALGMLDDDYRELLHRLTKHRSAKDCNAVQLLAVVAEMERMGFRSTAALATPRRTPATHPVANKARAMWISLHQLGAIDDASEAALETFGKRQLGVDRLQWADQRQGFRLIEALKAIGERHGWDQRVPSRAPVAERIRLLKDRLVAAQLARLAERGVAVAGPVAGDRSTWSTAQLEAAARRLADDLRDTDAA